MFGRACVDSMMGGGVKLRRDFRRLVELQIGEEVLKGLWEHLEKGETIADCFMLKGQILFTRRKDSDDEWRVCVPKVLQRKLL